ncbi:hypothetical protein [Spirosoma pulveris]
MSTALIKPAYFILHLREGQYCLTATQDWVYTFHRIEFLSETLKLLVIGVFDAKADRFHWRLTEGEKTAHAVSVKRMLTQLKSTTVYRTGFL